jgi:Regulator of ribonuclease activity B
MIQSPFLRTILVVALLAFAAFCVQVAWTEGGQGTWLLVVLALGSVTVAVGLVFPGRRRIALRLVAACVVIVYLIYFGAELFSLLRGTAQPIRLGQPSAIMAGLGILIWGVPLLIYSLSGRTLGEHAAEAAIAADRTGAIRDRQTIDALVRAGADLELPTEVRFYLELPTEGHARSVANVGEREGFSVEFSSPQADDILWTCCLGQQLAPTWDNIRRARARFEELASALGGTVDGWEAAVRGARNNGTL